MQPRRIVVIGYDGLELVDLGCVTTGLTLANRIAGAGPVYDVVLATPGGRPVRCDSGLEVRGQQALSRVTGAVDTVVVSGGLGHGIAAADGHIVGHVRRLARQARRIASVCTGASVLAAAGLLDGRRATTHWMYADELAERFPTVTVDPGPIFIRDGNVSTSGGVTAALDLTLAFIEEDHGAELARRVAMGMVTYLQRPGNQAQMSIFVRTPRPEHLTVRRIVDHIAANPGGNLSAANLAAVAGVSERHLRRLLVQHAGRTPARLVRQVRLDAAAQALATTGLPVSAIARQNGFGSAETLRHAFTAGFGISPTRYRAAHRSSRPG